MITQHYSKEILAVQDSLRKPAEVGRLAKGLYYLDPVTDKYISVAEILDLPRTQGYRVEVDFGELPLAEKTFTIQNPKVVQGSVITAEVAYETPTGKNIDEIEMDSFQVKCGNGNGSFPMIVSTTDGSYLEGNFKINYFVWQQ